VYKAHSAHTCEKSREPKKQGGEKKSKVSNGTVKKPPKEPKDPKICRACVYNSHSAHTCGNLKPRRVAEPGVCKACAYGSHTAHTCSLRGKTANDAKRAAAATAETSANEQSPAPQTNESAQFQGPPPDHPSGGLPRVRDDYPQYVGDSAPSIPGGGANRAQPPAPLGHVEHTSNSVDNGLIGGVALPSMGEVVLGDQYNPAFANPPKNLSQTLGQNPGGFLSDNVALALQNGFASTLGNPVAQMNRHPQHHGLYMNQPTGILNDRSREMMGLPAFAADHTSILGGSAIDHQGTGHAIAFQQQQLAPEKSYGLIQEKINHQDHGDSSDGLGFINNQNHFGHVSHFGYHNNQFSQTPHQFGHQAQIQHPHPFSALATNGYTRTLLDVTDHRSGLLESFARV